MHSTLCAGPHPCPRRVFCTCYKIDLFCYELQVQVYMSKLSSNWDNPSGRFVYLCSKYCPLRSHYPFATATVRFDRSRCAWLQRGFLINYGCVIALQSIACVSSPPLSFFWWYKYSALPYLLAHPSALLPMHFRTFPSRLCVFHHDCTSCQLFICLFAMQLLLLLCGAITFTTAQPETSNAFGIPHHHVIEPERYGVHEDYAGRVYVHSSVRYGDDGTKSELTYNVTTIKGVVSLDRFADVIESVSCGKVIIPPYCPTPGGVQREDPDGMQRTL